MPAAAATQAKSNEPGQAALDALNLARIRQALGVVATTKEGASKAVNSLRGIYAQTQMQKLDNEAAKVSLKLVEGGDEAIDAFCEMVRNVGTYVAYLGKVLSPRQFELFGMAGTGPTPEDERAKIEGRAAGFKLDGEQGSQESDNTYETGSIKGQAWLSAFRQARSERDAILAMPQPQPEAPAAEGGENPNESDG